MVDQRAREAGFFTTPLLVPPRGHRKGAGAPTRRLGMPLCPHPDGSARCGIVVAIKETTNTPVKFIGLGETSDDVEPFDPEQFAEAMFTE